MRHLFLFPLGTVHCFVLGGHNIIHCIGFAHSSVLIIVDISEVFDSLWGLLGLWELQINLDNNVL